MIPWDEHKSWLRNRLKTLDELPFLAYLSEDELVAFARLEKYKDGYAISILVNPTRRGHGIGTYVVNDFKLKLNQICFDNPLYAVIHKENLASIRLFQRCGYQFYGFIDGNFYEFLFNGSFLKTS